MKLIHYLLIFTITISLISCKSGTDSKFDFLEGETQEQAAPVTVSISSYSPTAVSTVLTNSETKTFVVALAATDSGVSYQFNLKRISTGIITTLQNGANPYINISGSTLSAGAYELIVTASNSTSSDSHTFSLRKNTAPAVPPTALTFSPTSLTGLVLNCGSSSQVFESDLGDADSDALTISWKLDSSSTHPTLVDSSNQTHAQATFTPSCSETGLKTIELYVNDGYETSSKVWTVSVVNPTVVSINSYSPTTDPIWINSTGSQIFNVSATGKAPLAYEWKLNGSVLSSFTSDYATINGSSLTTTAAGQSHTLVAKVSDSDSNQSRTFNIKKNAPPTITSKSPTNSTVNINVNTVVNFTANYTDDNSDTVTITWKLNNSIVGGSNPNASISNGSNSTTLTFTPSASVLGENTVELILNDSKETTTFTWTATVNYFSDTCNNMGAGKICTILGRPGMGSNINPLTSPEKTRIFPDFIEPYGDAEGSYFFTDTTWHTVWFYNKASTSKTILGQTIGANTLKAVLGLGEQGIGTHNTYYYDFPLTNPRGVAWDNANQRLFISDDSNSRVLMLDSSGKVYVIFGGGGNNAAGNANGALATASYCQYPYGLALSPSQNRLYVGCYGTHSIKYVDISNPDYTLWTATILVGQLSSNATSAGTVDGTNGAAGTAKVNTPVKLKFDEQNKILYSYTNGDCRIRATETNGTNRSNYFFNAVTLGANSTVTVAGNGCGTLTTNTGYATTRFDGNARNGIALHMSGSTLNGIFLADYDVHRVIYLNNTNGSVTLGNTAVSAYSSNTIWGNGTNGYYMPCSSATSASCYLNNPSDVVVINNKLHLADLANYRIRTLAVNATNGSVAAELGYDAKAGFGGNGGQSTELVQLNTPINLYYDSNGNKLLISDFNNQAIRSLNLTTGRIDGYIGLQGGGNANTSNADPTTVRLRGVRGIVNYSNLAILYNDTQDANTANRNCVMRAYNTTASVQNILGVTTNGGFIETVLGSYVNGCGAIPTGGSAPATGTAANIKIANPVGITSDGTNVYIANTNDHCILKLGSDGTLTQYLGLCGTLGTANIGAGVAYNDSGVRFTYPTAVVVDPRTPYNSSGNLFILDATSNNATTGYTKIRYVNRYSSAVTIWGVTVNPNEIKTVYTATNYFGTDLAAYDNQICFSSGGNVGGGSSTNGVVYYTSHNGTSSNSDNTVVCIDRDNDGSTTKRFGRSPASYIGRGAIPHDTEDEGIDARNTSFAGPAGLAFDSNGNLYIAERNAHVIRMIKKWW